MLEEHFRDRMAIGAGTVVNPAQVELTYQVKAAYIVSLNVNEVATRKTKELGMLSIPGVLSPSEVLGAHEYSVDYVKLFLAARVTASYIKDLMGPISHVKFIAAAGITEENIVGFTAVSCTGHSISGRLTDKRVIQEGHFEELQHHAEAFITCLREEEEQLHEKYCIYTC